MTDASSVDRLVAAALDAAQRAMDRGQWDDAAEVARHVLEVVPGDPAAAALLATAEARGRQGSTDQGRRYLTVLFSDVVGSTPLSERLDPEDYLSVMAAYREVVRDVLARHDGHIDQFQGDGVVAYFGFPVASEDDQVRAVEAGLEIVHQVPAAGREMGVELASRVGIHVGRTVMTSSDLGARERSRAIGFSTNVAARIQGLAGPGTVVVSETVVESIAAFFELVPIGAKELRGVSEHLEVFTVAEPRARSTMGDIRLSAPLVGRHDERARIESAWRAVRGDGDDSRVVVITGEAGFGKSRLARHAMEVAQTDGAIVIEINCGRAFRHVGLGAVRRGVEKALDLGATPKPADVRAALRQRAGAVGLAEGSARVLESLMGAAASTTPELAPDRLREAIIAALIDWIGAEARTAPVALVVEDLQWADDTAVEILRQLTGRPLPAGLLVLMTARTGGMPKALERLLADAIELGPLTGKVATDMVRAFAGAGELDDATIEALAQRGEGVPLFTEHLVMAAIAGGSNDALPATLEGLLQVRLDATGPGRSAAEVAATVGREFTLDLVERTLVELGDRSPLPLAALPGALRVLQRAGLVEPHAKGTMRFRHSLVRDVAYELQLRADRPARHRAVAQAVLAIHGAGAPPVSLAYHLEQAGDFEPAASAYLRAAEAAADLAEFDNALEQLRVAGTIIDRLEGPTAHRLDLARCMQIGSVSAASFSYARAEAEGAYLRALELCDLIAAEEGPDAALDAQLAAALGGLWSKEVVAGDLAAASSVTDRLERRITQAPADLEPEIRRFVLGCRGFELLFAGATTDAIVPLRQASMMQSGPLAVPLGTPHDYVAAADALLAAAYALTCDNDAADETLERALRRTRQLPFPVGPFSEAVVQVYGSYIHRLRGDVRAARLAAQAMSDIGDRHGFREHAVLGHILGLAASALEGDGDACQALQSTLGIWRMAGGGLAVPVLLAELAEGCVRAGDHTRARAALDDAIAMMDQTGQRGPEPEVMRIGAQLERSEGASQDEVLKRLCAAADLALDRGSLLFAARALRDADQVLAGRLDEHGHDLTERAARLYAILPTSADGERREMERLLSASA